VPIREREQSEPQAATAVAEPEALVRTLSPEHVLSLQRTAGNQAVMGWLARLGDASSSSSPSSGSSGSQSSQSSGGSSGSSGGGDAGGGGAATPVGVSDPSRCAVDVRATHIGGILSGAPVWHLYLVHTDEFGRQTGWRGGPSGSGGAGGFGEIIGTTGPYDPGFIDWDPGAPSVNVGMGPSVCGKTTDFASELSRIDGTRTPYSPTGPNSNTWVKTVLTNSGLPARKPVLIAPGFGDPAL
jgi:hypothetical protein